MIYCLQVKVKLIWIAVIALVVSLSYRLKGNTDPRLDGTLVNALAQTAEFQSVRAQSRDYDKNGKQTGDVAFELAGDDWLMKLMEGTVSASSWAKKGSFLYVLNTNDSSWWKLPDRGEVKHVSKIDVRKNAARLLADLRSGKLQAISFGSEPCEGDICFRYQIYDANDTELSRYLWISNHQKVIFQEQYLLGNGQTSMTVYRDYGRTTISQPEEEAIIHEVSDSADPFTLPGVVKLY